MHIALLGGSFNPPHVGHLLGASYVHATQGVDEVWLMPVFSHPFGKALVPFEHRLAMCELLCAETSGWLRASAVESEVGKTGRTVDTLDFLRGRFPEHQWTLIVGTDILPELPRWQDWARIQTLARVLVLNRAGHPAPEGVGPPLAQVSATNVRARMSRGEDVGELVPRGVLDYLKTHKLFG